MDDFRVIEKKWQNIWNSNNFFTSAINPQKKFYNFDSAPFTNGCLHLGHARNYVLGDVLARFKRLVGYNVLYVTSFDAFGLPNELAANAKNLPVSQYVSQNIKLMLEDFKRLGISYDYDKIKTTCNPDYYKWTQWLFLQLYRNGFVERKKVSANWCVSCETSLSYMEVTESACNRCGSQIIKKHVNQWVIKTSDLLDELYASINERDEWSERIKKILKGYYSPLQGGLYQASIVDAKVMVDVFISDSNEGSSCSRIVSSLHNKTLSGLMAELKNSNQDLYLGIYEQLQSLNESLVGKHPRRRAMHGGDVEFDTGLVLSISDAVKLPLWISGAIDVEVGPQFSLEGNDVFGVAHSALKRCDSKIRMKYYYVHDWNVSRQKNWGTPVPILNCKKCGFAPVSEDDLPVLHVDHQTENNDYFCPSCSERAELVSEVLDCYLDDSWCFIAGAVSTLTENPFLVSKNNPWLPADHYHAGFDTFNYLHVYRLISLYLYQSGILKDKEMFLAHQGHDMVMMNNNKISKSGYSYESLSKLLDEFGADVIRLALIMSCGPGKTIQLTDEFFETAINFIKNLKALFQKLLDIKSTSTLNKLDISSDLKKLQSSVSKSVEKARKYYDSYRPNVAVQELQISIKNVRRCVATNSDGNLLYKNNIEFLMEVFCDVVLTLSPVIPHVAEELWSISGTKKSVSTEGFSDITRR